MAINLGWKTTRGSEPPRRLARLISSSMLAGMVAVDQPHHYTIILILTPPPLVTHPCCHVCPRWAVQRLLPLTPPCFSLPHTYSPPTKPTANNFELADVYPSTKPTATRQELV